jgi:hypothetical protein
MARFGEADEPPAIKLGGCIQASSEWNLAVRILASLLITVWRRTASASLRFSRMMRGEKQLTHLTFLLNFFDELRRRAPADK